MTRKISSFVFTILLTWMFVIPVTALEVNEPELESVSPDAVVFINYTGPHTVIDSLEQIKNIGSSLGTVIATNPESAGTAGNPARYYVIHAVDPETQAGLDADILIVGENATVDHIRNLRHIIAAYLTAAYNYSEQDAQTLAVFITVYNAVYRGNMDAFNSKYKPVVTQNLTSDKAGLALNYQDWPGKSQIVIPLSNPTGGLSTIDTGVISDKQVVESLREEEDMGIDVRKDLVDIKEREADIAEEQAAEAQKQAVQETEKQQQEEQKLAEVKKEAETAQEEAETARREAEANPDDVEAQKEAEQKAQIAEEKQQEVEEQTQKTQEQTQIAEEKRQEAAEQQAVADQKREEARIDRTEIAKDQQKLILAGRTPDADGVYGLRILDDTFSTMVKLNKTNGSVIKESPVTVIRGRTLLPAGDNYMAVAGRTGGNAAVKVVLLDTINMEIVAESAEFASEQSVLVQDGDAYYAVIQDTNGWVLGKYNSDLKLLLKSKITVHPATPVTVTEAGICVTATDGSAKLLSLSNLDEIK